jgi:phosphoenolpyruvate carboxylase
MVTVLTPTYVMARDDTEPVQVVVTPLDVSADSLFKVGDETVRDEPELRFTEKLVGLTVMESTTALEPETFSVYPPTEMTVSVVRVTSLEASAITGMTQIAIVVRVRRVFIHLMHLLFTNHLVI